jgi:hypothetical protein
MTGDTITIVRARGRRLSKRFLLNGELQGYDSVRTYDLHQRPVAGLDALQAVLTTIQHHPDCAVVRGAIADPARTRRVRRLVHRDPKTDDQPTLRELARRWVSLDFDGVPAPEGLDRRDLLACARVLLPALPEPWRTAELIVQATSSHLMKPGIRLRLWGWCDRPLSGDELRRWFRGVPVDPSGFGPAQVCYVAAPVFETGLTDPLSERLVRLPGASPIIVAPSAAALGPPPRPAAPAPGQSTAGGNRYAMTALARACGNIARQSEGNRHPTALSEAWSLARLVHAGLLSEAEVVRAVEGALRHTGKPDGEGEKIVAWAISQRGSAGSLPVMGMVQ